MEIKGVENLPTFGSITNILLVREETFLIVQIMKTESFHEGLLSYHVEFTPEKCLIRLDEVPHCFPLFPKTILGNTYVKLTNSSVIEFIHQ
jgi:hypothetical protein